MDDRKISMEEALACIDQARKTNGPSAAEDVANSIWDLIDREE